jgi:hypothetical protein
VPEHRIRLRGGWESCPVGAPAESERVTLPTRWGPKPSGRVRLIRRFGSPPLGPGRHVLLLKMEKVPGVHSIRLNEQEIPHVSPEISDYEITLHELAARNVLVLEVDPTTAQGGTDAQGAHAEGQGPDGSSDWGCIALVIQTHPEGKAAAEPV